MHKSRSGHVINFEVDQDKVQKILEFKNKLGADFPRFGILVLTYNAKDHIEKTLSRIPIELKDAIEEIFIFDDNSPDNTYEYAQNLLSTSKWSEKLSIYKNPKNLRYGGNQKAGYRYAINKGIDYVIMLHGDGQYAPEYVPDLMLPALEENKQVVFGSRMINKRDALKGGMPLYKFVGNQVLTRFENLILGTSLYEFHSGYRMYSMQALKQIPFEENTNEFHFDSQIIVQCRALGVDIHEVPIKTFYGDEVCNVDGIKYAKDVCVTVLEYRLHQLHLIRRGHYLLNKEFQYSRKRSPFSSHEKILSQIPKDSKVLEIGGSAGLLYNSIIEKNCTYQCADTSATNRVNIPSENYHKFSLESYKDIKFDREFDYIVIPDLIQKVPNPKELIEHFSTFLKPNGSLIISVPNIAIWFYRLSLAIGRFNYGNKGILDKTNLRFFTKFSACQLIERSGLEIQSLDVTGLPFEVVFESIGKSKVLGLFDRLYYSAAKMWHKLFAYQFVIRANITTLDNKSGEGKITLQS